MDIQTRLSIVVYCNDVSRTCGYTRGPILCTCASRELLIAWLCWNDRNGCYSDEDCMAEWGEVMTHGQAWEALDNVTEDREEDLPQGPVGPLRVRAY